MEAFGWGVVLLCSTLTDSLCTVSIFRLNWLVARGSGALLSSSRHKNVRHTAHARIQTWHVPLGLSARIEMGGSSIKISDAEVERSERREGLGAKEIDSEGDEGANNGEEGAAAGIGMEVDVEVVEFEAMGVGVGGGVVGGKGSARAGGEREEGADVGVSADRKFEDVVSSKTPFCIVCIAIRCR